MHAKLSIGVLSIQAITMISIIFCSDQGAGAQLLIKGIAQSADAGPGGWVGLKRKLLHLDVDGSGAVNAEGEQFADMYHGAGSTRWHSPTVCFEYEVCTLRMLCLLCVWIMPVV